MYTYIHFDFDFDHDDDQKAWLFLRIKDVGYLPNKTAAFTNTQID
jgi:hypothetical protein